MVETTTRALTGPKNENGTWNLDSTSFYWKELVRKLLRAERALRYFHAREGFPAVKQLFLDSPSFSHIRVGVLTTDFNEFFDWFFEQKLPEPVSTELNNHTNAIDSTLDIDSDMRGVIDESHLRHFLARLCEDPQLAAVH